MCVHVIFFFSLTSCVSFYGVAAPLPFCVGRVCVCVCDQRMCRLLGTGRSRLLLVWSSEGGVRDGALFPALPVLQSFSISSCVYCKGVGKEEVGEELRPQAIEAPGYSGKP